MDLEGGLGRGWTTEYSWTETLLERLPFPGMLNIDDGDLVGTYWLPNERRLNQALMLNGHLDGSIVMVARMEKADASQRTLERIFSFALPFKFDLWLVITFVIFTSGLVSWLIERDHVPSLTLSSAIYENYAGVLFGGFATPATRASAFYQIATAFFFIVIVSLYTATLAAAIAGREDVAFSASSLAAIAADGNLELCEAQGGAWNSRFRLGHPGLMTLTKAPDGHPLGEESGAELLLDGSCDAIIATRQNYVDWRTNSSYCRFRVAETIYSYNSGWVTNRDSTCVAMAINWGLNVLENDGTLDRILAQTFRTRSCRSDEALEIDSLESTGTALDASSGGRRRLTSGAQQRRRAQGIANADALPERIDAEDTRWGVDAILGLLFLWAAATVGVVTPTLIRKLGLAPNWATPPERPPRLTTKQHAALVRAVHKLELFRPSSTRDEDRDASKQGTPAMPPASDLPDATDDAAVHGGAPTSDGLQKIRV